MKFTIDYDDNQNETNAIVYQGLFKGKSSLSVGEDEFIRISRNRFVQYFKDIETKVESKLRNFKSRTEEANLYCIFPNNRLPSSHPNHNMEETIETTEIIAGKFTDVDTFILNINSTGRDRIFNRVL